MFTKFRNLRTKRKENKKSSKRSITDESDSPMEVDPPESVHNPRATVREEMITFHNRAQRGNVFAPSVDINEEFVIPVYPKSEASIQFIDNSLADNFIFASLSNSERRIHHHHPARRSR